MLIQTDLLGSLLSFSEMVIEVRCATPMSSEKSDLKRYIVKGEGEREGISKQLGLQVQG